jgi:glucosamine-6-phosphate deaminase
MSRKAALLAAEGINREEECLISFPGGDTPLGMVEEFTVLVNQGHIDISKTRYVSLDEWVGLGVHDHGSCAWFNTTHLLNRLTKPFLETFIINGQAQDITAECKRLNGFIDQYGPLRVSVVGIGLNGHLGFNEEGVDFNLDAHVIPLSAVTKSVMSKYFDRARELEFGITQGLKQIMAAERIILIANGAHKADILRRAFHGPVDPSVPASILQRHPNCYVVSDREAAAGL